MSFTNPGGSTAVEEIFVTPFGKELNTNVCIIYVVCKTELPVSLLLTVHARITNFSPVPDLGDCLKTGSDVDIVCENIAFPVGRVEFTKDLVDISDDRYIYIYMCVYCIVYHRVGRHYM